VLCRAAQEKSRAPAVVVFAVGRDSLTEEACEQNPESVLASCRLAVLPCRRKSFVQRG